MDESSSILMACESFHSFYDDDTIISGPDPTIKLKDGIHEIKKERTKFH